jgi:hypothetical protein
MPEHNFKIGQRLFLARPGSLNVPDSAAGAHLDNDISNLNI